MEYYLALNKSEILIYTEAWTDHCVKKKMAVYLGVSFRGSLLSTHPEVKVGRMGDGIYGAL